MNRYLRRSRPNSNNNNNESNHIDMTTILDSPPNIRLVGGTQHAELSTTLQQCKPVITQNHFKRQRTNNSNDFQDNLSPQPLANNNHTTTTTTTNNNNLDEPNDTNGDDDDNDEIIIQSSTVTNPNISFSHFRKLCGVFPFDTDPSQHCPKCYCSVCNQPAKDCKDWSTHCHINQEELKPSKKKADVRMFGSSPEVQPISTAEVQSLQNEEVQAYYRDWNESERLNNNNSSGNRRREKSDKHLRITDILARKLSLAINTSELQNLHLSSSTTTSSNTNNNDNTSENSKMSGDIPQLGLHKSFFMEGIRIGWPFPVVMPPQRKMALHLIRALKRSLHVVLESPTGTGKSAAILCSVLAWQRYHAKGMISNSSGPTFTSYAYSGDCDSNGLGKGRGPQSMMMDSEGEGVGDGDVEVLGSKPKVPQIIYCTRTHSQVAQMVNSLKQTPYRPRMTVLGSRDRLCIHRNLRTRGRSDEREKPSRQNINQECQFRVSNTERMRKAIWNSSFDHYDDDNPPTSAPGDGEGMSVEDGGDGGDRGDRGDGGQTENDFTNPVELDDVREHVDREEAVYGTKKKMTCPHYRQLSSSRTSVLARSRFIVDKSVINCCQVGGKKTRLGVHDIEDLVSFGVNPYVQKGVALYRKGGVGSFGMRLKENKGGLVSINSLAKDGAAELTCGDVKEKDSLLRVNGKDCRKWDFDQVVNEIKTTKNDPLEIDLLRSGVLQDVDEPGDIYSDHSACPYFLSKALSKHAELIFAPYNYVLDPSIRNALDIELDNAVVILDEAHNVEDTLRGSGSGKFGEFELCDMVCLLADYATKEKNSANEVSVGENEEKMDISVVSHNILLMIEKMVEFLRSSRKRFENAVGKNSAREAIAEYEKFRTSDDKEFEVTFDGPTGRGIGGKAIGCKPFFVRMGFTVNMFYKLEDFGEALDNYVGGGISADDHQSFIEKKKGSNLVSRINELIGKLRIALERPEHFFVQSAVKANGSMAFASGEDDGSNRSRFQKKPKSIPFVRPRTDKHPNVPPHPCHHRNCQTTLMGARHGEFCDGTTPRWESVLVLELLTPGILMEEITDKCRTVVLASGSLAPISSLCAELNLHPPKSNPIKSSPVPSSKSGKLQIQPRPLEADHVIDLNKQLRAISIGNFPDGSTLTVSYGHYQHLSFFPKLGHAIASIVEAIPRGGVLVFVPSYSFLKKCINSWNPYGDGSRWSYSHFEGGYEDASIWERLLKSKGRVIVEPTGSQDKFEEAKEEYNNAIVNSGKCVLLAVFRGKMSEGISFNDDHARGVICVGLPLPGAFDKAIVAKRAYNDEQRKFCHRLDLLPGQDWYLQQAYRAIAQALGRCIRHGADYGTVILLDSRHCDDGAPVDGICRKHLNLPKWMRREVRNLSQSERNLFRGDLENGNNTIFGGYPGLAKELKQFFEQAPIHSKTITEKWEKDLKIARERVNHSLSVEFSHNNEKWSVSKKKELDPQTIIPSTKNGSEQSLRRTLETDIAMATN